MDKIISQKTDPWDPPCMIQDLPFSDYLDIDAASSHKLWTLLKKSPKHMKESTYKPSAAMALGTATHALLLEPDKASEQIVVKPENANKSSNANKEILLEWISSVLGENSNAGADLAHGKMLSARIDDLEPKIADTGITICTQEQYDKARWMRDSVLDKDIGKVLFAAGMPEVTMLAFDPVTGILCKGRADWIPSGHNLIVDVKTAQSVSFDDFARASAQYGYPAQASLYKNLYWEITKVMPSFLHVAIESEHPFDCAFYEMDEKALDIGGQHVRRALDIWKLCEQADLWPGVGYDFPTNEYTIQSLSLPRWAL